MFYPAGSLKRGGRFHLCWLADTWPSQFETLSSRQLSSSDIRELCDDLMEEVTSESRCPACRYSLRLSAQLVHGLVKVLEKKASLLLGDLCMINAQVLRHSNKRNEVPVQGQVRHVPRPVPLELPRPELPAEPQEQSLEEIIQNRGNVVANIHDITLKEATIPEIQIPPYDGFGEENPDQMLQQLLVAVEQILELDMNPMVEDIADRTVEQMLHQLDTSAAQHSGLDLDVDKSNKSNADKSLLVQDRQMEPISEQDTSVMRQSTASKPLELDFEMDIPGIPEIVPPQPPVIPDPDIPAVRQIVISEPEEPVAVAVVPMPREAPRQPEPELDIELEELEQEQVSRPRRRLRARRGHLIVHKSTVLKRPREYICYLCTRRYLSARVGNVHIEQRCEDAGCSRRPTRSIPVVPEEPEQPPEVQEPEPRVEQPAADVEMADGDNTRGSDVVPNITDDAINVTEVEGTSDHPFDLSEMATEVLQVLASQGSPLKRSKQDKDKPAKRFRPSASGHKSYHERSGTSNEKENIPLEDAQPGPAPAQEPASAQEPAPAQEPASAQEPAQAPSQSAKAISAMLHDDGIADIPTRRTNGEQAMVSQAQVPGGSDETPLGSLESVKSTESHLFIRTQWGLEGTMVKIMEAIDRGCNPITLNVLLRNGPLLPGLKNIIAARLFSSILKLKHRGFIKVIKHPETSEIMDITYGPRLS